MLLDVSGMQKSINALKMDVRGLKLEMHKNHQP